MKVKEVLEFLRVVGSKAQESDNTMICIHLRGSGDVLDADVRKIAFAPGVVGIFTNWQGGQTERRKHHGTESICGRNEQRSD